MGNLKEKDGPRILHIITKKGKGYKLAEQNPISYHGVTPFDIKTGIVKKGKINNKLTYTQIFSRTINYHINKFVKTAALEIEHVLALLMLFNIAR